MSAIEKAIKENNLEQAEALCQQLLEKNAYDLEGLYFKAIVLRKQEAFNESIDVHNSLINLIPNNADFIAERGLTFHFMKQENEAMADFTKAIELEPANAYRYSSRAFVRNFYGDTIGALEDYDKAIALDPEDVIALNNKGVIEESMGKFDEARASYDQSDKISGVDQTIKKITNEPLTFKPIHSPVISGKLNFKEYIRILWRLLSTKAERKSFFKFLFNRK